MALSVSNLESVSTKHYGMLGNYQALPRDVQCGMSQLPSDSETHKNPPTLLWTLKATCQPEYHRLQFPHLETLLHPQAHTNTIMDRRGPESDIWIRAFV